MTCLKTLREAARVEVKPKMKQLLQDTADNLADAIAVFRDQQTTEALVDLNGRWARSVYVLKLATPIPDPPPFPSFEELEQYESAKGKAA